MTSDELRIKKAEFLTKAINNCLNQEPKLSYEEICFILIAEIGLNNMPEFLKKYKQEQKSLF